MSVPFIPIAAHRQNVLDAPSAIAIDAAHLRHCDTCHRGSAQGKLLYRGMIWSLRLATTALFEDGSASFELFAIEEVCPRIPLRWIPGSPQPSLTSYSHVSVRRSGILSWLGGCQCGDHCTIFAQGCGASRCASRARNQDYVGDQRTLKVGH